ncbi:hypothetical protein [uncultured Tolumonas sp.]|uniref:hypothetical protein n=1 Tax=uncultured Tolumonas sp. TaxID=263765 RepID=UPI00292CE7F3|nr:hypothetical protein [uncultured Tolumonas sp.]
MIKIISCILLVFASTYSFACKDPLYKDKYQITNFSGYSDVIVARIITSKHNDDEMYSPLMSFDAAVLEKIKGALTPNQVIHVSAKIEDPRAACPLYFKENSTYLLLLERQEGELQISRFSFPIESNNEHFSSYLSQVKSGINIH